MSLFYFYRNSVLVSVQEYSVTFFLPNKVSRMKVNHSKVNKHSVLRLSNTFLIGFEVFTPNVPCLCEHQQKITTDHMTFEFEQ